MNPNRFSIGLPALLTGLGLAAACSLPALADDAHQHNAGAQTADYTKEQFRRNGELVRIVRDATRRYQNVRVAEAEGYSLMFGCVSGESDSAMGLHYVNGQILNEGKVEAARPQIVIYEAHR